MSQSYTEYQSFAVEGQNGSLKLHYNYPIRLNPAKKYVVGITGGYLPISWTNVQSPNNTVKVSNDAGVTWTTITIPDGLYGVGDVGSYLHTIQLGMTGYVVSGGTTLDKFDDIPGIGIGYDPNSMRTVITLYQDFQIDLDTMYTFFGFLPVNKVVTIDNTYSDDVPEEAGDYRYYKIKCSLVDPVSQPNGSLEQNLYINNPVNSLGGIQELPQNGYVAWKSMSAKEISSIEVSITNQDNAMLNLRGQIVCVIIDIKPL